jgi:hypothetical protein
MDGDFSFLIYVMDAAPVQLLICGSYNYFKYWYEIIIRHKTASHICGCLICRHVGVWAHSFGKRGNGIKWHLG